MKKKRNFKDIKKDNAGMGVIEVILIIVVLVGLVVVFREQIGTVVDDIFGAITDGVAEIIGE